MASSFDLAPRLAALQAMGLDVASDYNGQPARWLQTALDDCDLRVINVKGIRADNTICMIRLSFLEKLLATVEASLDGTPDHPMKEETPHGAMHSPQ